MSNLYLFWSHNEDGPENLKATLDRSQVVDIAKSYDRNGWLDRDGAWDELSRLLLKTDVELLKGDGIHNLMDGWGGLHFQIVELIGDVKPK